MRQTGRFVYLMWLFYWLIKWCKIRCSSVSEFYILRITNPFKQNVYSISFHFMYKKVSILWHASSPWPAIWLSRHAVVCQQPRETQDAQCVIYRKRKVADFNPLYLLNYLENFYQIYIFYALHIHAMVCKIYVHFQKLPNFLHIFLLPTAFEEFWTT